YEAATCTTRQRCSRCGEETGELNPANHTGVEERINQVPATCTSVGHTGELKWSCCGEVAEADSEIPMIEHNFADATCCKPKTCRVCGYEEGDVDSNNHIAQKVRWREGESPVVPTLALPEKDATCTEEGYTGDLYCSGCGVIVDPQDVGQSIAALGHTGGTATCSRRAVCDRCGAEYGEIDANNHSGNTELRGAVTATCVRQGYTGDLWCLDCNQQISTGSVIASGAHAYVDTVVSPTCTQRGYTIHLCSICGDMSESDYVNELGHDYETVTTEADSSTNTPGAIVVRCRRCGDIQSNTPIAFAQAATLSTTSYTYNGSRKKPTVTVKDSNGQIIDKSNYTVTYINNLKVGKATVKVTMKGGYSGTFTKQFTIRPPATSFTKVAGITKGIRVYWKKKTTQTTGYQIQYSTTRNFAEGSTSMVSTTKGFASKQITRLSSNKKYYVRIRTYTKVKVDGRNTNIYSSWSATRTVKSR
ncbi:MAG: fibronectin type III domain-containing protein, partial [Agathobacter sp.]|nr:fibronectin type III domain-containing protein [Agathobacter sp.]